MICSFTFSITFWDSKKKYLKNGWGFPSHTNKTEHILYNNTANIKNVNTPKK